MLGFQSFSVKTEKTSGKFLREKKSKLLFKTIFISISGKFLRRKKIQIIIQNYFYEYERISLELF